MKEIGINLYAVPGIAEEDYIRQIAELGFTATFSMAKDRPLLERLGSLCAANGIRFDSLHAPFKGINSIWLEGEDGGRMLASLRDCVDKCLMVGAPIAVVHLSSGQTPPSITDVGRGRFSELVEYAMQKGIKLAFENQRKLFNLAWALEAFGPETGVGFCWDSGHEGCFTPGKEFLPLFSERLSCVHLHDNRGQFNEDLHLLPFDGELNFSRIACQLRKARFAGPLMLEVMTHTSDCYPGLTPEQYLRRAAKAAHKLAEMV